MILDVRVLVDNGYGVKQEYSVDVWQGWSLPSLAYVVPNNGGPRDTRPIRRGTKVYKRVVEAAKAKIAGGAT